MERNTNAQNQKEKLTLNEIFDKKLSYDNIVEYYFPNKDRYQRKRILWEQTAFPYVDDKLKILDQIYSYYIKTISDPINNNNRKTSTIVF